MGQTSALVRTMTFRLAVVPLLLLMPSSALAASRPTFTAAATQPPAAVKACLVDHLLDARMTAQAVEHHDGWRVTFMPPNFGAYYAEVQPASKGSTVEVFGFRAVAKGVLPALRECAVVADAAK